MFTTNHFIWLGLCAVFIGVTAVHLPALIKEVRKNEFKFFAHNARRPYPV